MVRYINIKTIVVEEEVFYYICSFLEIGGTRIIWGSI